MSATPGPSLRQPAHTRLASAGSTLRRRWSVRRWALQATPRWHIALGAALVLLAIVVIAIAGDAALAVYARNLPSAVRAAGRIVTTLGDSLYIFLLSAIGMVVPLLMRGGQGAYRARDAALAHIAGRSAFVFAVAAFSGILAQVLKHLIGRARPRLFDEFGAFHFVWPGYPSVYASFPSGHTITAFACAMAIGFFLPRWRLPLFALAALIGASRVVVGAHYPTDVVGGAVIGVLSALIARRAFAARGIVFRVWRGVIAPRGVGRIVPALRRRIG